MTDHKFTDAEIIKALKCCANSCKGCPLDKVDTGDICGRSLVRYSVDLINRQKAEIKGLSVELDLAKAFYKEKEAEFSLLNYQYNKTLNQLNDYQSITRAEAIKEFAEKLKKRKCHYNETEHTFDFDGVTVDDVDNLVEEMSKMHEG